MKLLLYIFLHFSPCLNTRSNTVRKDKTKRFPVCIAFCCLQIQEHAECSSGISRFSASLPVVG